MSIFPTTDLDSCLLHFSQDVLHVLVTWKALMCYSESCYSTKGIIELIEEGTPS
jgi:hypothetical protein